MMSFAALNPSYAVLKVVMGLMPAWQDAVRLGAEDITRLRTDHRVRRTRGAGCFLCGPPPAGRRARQPGFRALRVEPC